MKLPHRNHKHAGVIAALLTATSVPFLHAENWILNGNGNWNDAANWDPASVPNGVGAAANFSTIDITNHREVSVNAAITLGSMVFGDTNSSHSYKLTNGGASLTFDNGGSSSITNNTTRAPQIITPVTLNDNVIITADNANNEVQFNGTVDGVGGFTVNGTKLQLRSAAGGGTFSGPTILNDGANVMFPAGATNVNTNVLINEGILNRYYNATLNRALGTGANEVQILGGVSGFSGNRDLQIKINNSTSYEVVWGASGDGAATGFFNPSTLVLMGP